MSDSKLRWPCRSGEEGGEYGIWTVFARDIKIHPTFYVSFLKPYHEDAETFEGASVACSTNHEATM